MEIINSLKKIETRHKELEKLLSDHSVISDRNRFQELAKEHSQLQAVVSKFKLWEKLKSEINETQGIIDNNKNEFGELAREELEILLKKETVLQEELKGLLSSTNPIDLKNVILEIRAGTGGDEAALWAGELMKMYLRFAEKKGWRTEILSSHTTELGGIKEVIFSVEGKGVYGSLKYESGVHRVQRVPKTEASGRIHTSAATVAVFPDTEEKDIEIKQEDLKIDTYCSSGAGGQHVNKTSSAIRITHLPTGMVVQCQDERSQLKNKLKAMKVLRARLSSMIKEEEDKKQRIIRKQQVGSGDRSEKIRTYNFPQDRVTDHRINVSLYRLEDVMTGNIDEFIEKLRFADDN